MNILENFEFESLAQHLTTQHLLEIRDIVHREIKERGAVKKEKKSLKNNHVDSDCKRVPIGKKKVFPLKYIREPLNVRMKSLLTLLSQDWKYLFDGQDLDEEEKYYVYAHVSPQSGSHLKLKLKKTLNMNGIPFYVGKGCGERAFDLNRNQGHGIKIRNLISSGEKKEDIVCIVQDNLSEIEALELESKLIYFFGTLYEKSSSKAGKCFLYNLDKGNRPDFTRDGKFYDFVIKKKKKENLALNSEEREMFSVGVYSAVEAEVGATA